MRSAMSRAWERSQDPPEDRDNTPLMPPEPVADNPATPEDESKPGAWSLVGRAWRWITRT